LSTRLTLDTLEPLPRQFSTLPSQEQPDALHWITDSRSCQKWIKSGVAQKLRKAISQHGGASLRSNDLACATLQDLCKASAENNDLQKHS
jgi:hypothetical protein